MTFGNAKAIGLFAYNPETKKTFTEPVKALQKKNAFPIAHDQIEQNHVYIFVILNKPSVPVQYYVVPGSVLAYEPSRFTKWFTYEAFPGIPVAALESFENAWEIFSE